MNTKICTSIKQSNKLLSFGLDPSTADMMYREYETVIGDDYGYNYRLQTYNDENMEGVPCWSLVALLELMPKSINDYNNKTWRNYGLNLFRSYYYCCGYSFGPSLSEENHNSLCCFSSEESWLDAVYKTVIWCIEQGHIKVNK